MSNFIFGQGTKLSLDEICELKLYNKRIYTKFNDSKNLSNTAILHRYENCVISGNLLRDEIDTSKCDGIATRPDIYYYNNNRHRYPIINNISDSVYFNALNNKKKIGFLFRTIRDTSYHMFVVSCMTLFWYLKQILNYKHIQNEKISLVVSGGTNGGWQDPLYCIASTVQSKIINEIKKEKNMSWKEIHNEINNNTSLGVEIKKIILNYILDWKKNNNHNHPIENIKIGFDLSYILDIIKLLTDDYNVEIILEDKPLSFEYLYVGAPLAANFCNLFPDLSPNINSIFLNLRNKCLNKECNIENVSNDKCFITRYDKMYGLSHENKIGRNLVNEEELNNCLKNLTFEFINASYYNTLEKFHLFKHMKIFVIMEGGGLANMMFFPPNSKIIIISNGGWKNITNKQSESWWITWNKQHYGHLNHNIYIYDKVKCVKKKSNWEILTSINDINDFYKFVKNI